MGFFAGSDARGLLSISAQTYNDLWRVWGLLARPSDFDERVASRWGIAARAVAQPVSLPGEDPNLTDGGSGQLPTALTQMREADGATRGPSRSTVIGAIAGRSDSPSEGAGLGTLYGPTRSSEIGAAFRDYFNGLGAHSAHRRQQDPRIGGHPSLSCDRRARRRSRRHFNDSLAQRALGWHRRLSHLVERRPPHAEVPRRQLRDGRSATRHGIRDADRDAGAVRSTWRRDASGSRSGIRTCRFGSKH